MKDLKNIIFMVGGFVLLSIYTVRATDNPKIIPESIVSVTSVETSTEMQESETETFIFEESTAEVASTHTADVRIISDEELELLALVTMAEAEDESELGKRLVIDTVLNRVDSSHFPNTITDVIYQKHQFTSMWNGRYKKTYVDDYVRNLVLEELKDRTNSDVIFFRMDRYSDYGTPLFKEDGHYFSAY
jgi:hypothetical protein|nr:MAG TPA: lytic transglycosylase [Caudoviricetes sp.]